MLLEAFIRVADQGANCRHFVSHIFTVKNLEEEWFRQGDQEMRLSLPVSPNYDRHKDSAASMQQFFLECMVLPLVGSFSSFISEECAQKMKQNLADNGAGWDAAISQHGKKSSKHGAAVPMTTTAEVAEIPAVMEVMAVCRKG